MANGTYIDDHPTYESPSPEVIPSYFTKLPRVRRWRHSDTAEYIWTCRKHGTIGGYGSSASDAHKDWVISNLAHYIRCKHE